MKNFLSLLTALTIGTTVVSNTSLLNQTNKITNDTAFKMSNIGMNHLFGNNVASHDVSQKNLLLNSKDFVEIFDKSKSISPIPLGLFNQFGNQYVADFRIANDHVWQEIANVYHFNINASETEILTALLQATNITNFQITEHSVNDSLHTYFVINEFQGQLV